jgi:hypothetical protein
MVPVHPPTQLKRRNVCGPSHIPQCDALPPSLPSSLPPFLPPSPCAGRQEASPSAPEPPPCDGSLLGQQHA